MTSWPNQLAPGIPKNPEKTGWHWIVDERGVEFALPVKWTAGSGWDETDPRLWGPVSDYEYLGPLLTPADLAKQIDTECKCALEKAAAVSESAAALSYPSWEHPERIANEIRKIAQRYKSKP